MGNHIVIGIDQSYECTGITEILGNSIDSYTVLFSRAVKFKDCKTNTDKREFLHSFLHRKLESARRISRDITVIIERIRLHSAGSVSTSYIKSTGALIAVVIDVCSYYGIPVYSVDTRAWKARIVGTSQQKENIYGIDPKKYPTIEYVKKKGYLKYIVEPYTGKGKKGIVSVYDRNKREKVPCILNDNIADSICIAEYGLLPKSEQKLQIEKF